MLISGVEKLGSSASYRVERNGLDSGQSIGYAAATARLGRSSRIKMAIYAGTDKSAQVVFSFGERVKAALAGELKILSVGEVDLTLPSP